MFAFVGSRPQVTGVNVEKKIVSFLLNLAEEG
jgi:hypothetical protein